MKTKSKYWLRYTVEGSNNEKTGIDHAVSESDAKRHIKSMYKGFKVVIHECIKL
jgi:hypothetical protein